MPLRLWRCWSPSRQLFWEATPSGGETSGWGTVTSQLSLLRTKIHLRAHRDPSQRMRKRFSICWHFATASQKTTHIIRGIWGHQYWIGGSPSACPWGTHKNIHYRSSVLMSSKWLRFTYTFGTQIRPLLLCYCHNQNGSYRSKCQTKIVVLKSDYCLGQYSRNLKDNISLSKGLIQSQGGYNGQSGCSKERNDPYCHHLESISLHRNNQTTIIICFPLLSSRAQTMQSLQEMQQDWRMMKCVIFVLWSEFMRGLLMWNGRSPRSQCQVSRIILDAMWKCLIPCWR
jgi:hypothetical protein